MRIIGQPAFEADGATNPYNWLLYQEIISLGVDVDGFSITRLLRNKYLIWHRHWPEWTLNDSNLVRVIFKLIVYQLLISFVRFRGTKIVWTIHNLHSHEQFYPRLEKLFWKIFISQIDGYISLTQSALNLAQEEFPQLKNIPGFVIPIGHYRGNYLDEISKQEARSQLGINSSAKVLLFFGSIRRYKNTSKLIQVFKELGDTEAILYVVGKPFDSNLSEEIQQEVSSNSRIKLYLNFVPDDEVQIYFRATDLVVLPFSEILNSSSALLALSFDRPVLVPLQGSLGELKDKVGEEWVQTYTGEITVSKLEKAIEWSITIPRLEKPSLNAFDWKTIATQTINAYNSITVNNNK
jgi:glycosyltransferase involved in cell wall biosynthesis